MSSSSSTCFFFKAAEYAKSYASSLLCNDNPVVKDEPTELQPTDELDFFLTLYRELIEMKTFAKSCIQKI